MAVILAPTKIGALLSVRRLYATVRNDCYY